MAAARKRAGLLQVELAVEMGDRYDQTMISHVEAGRSGLVGDGLAKAAKALAVSTDYLLGLTDDPTPACKLSSIVDALPLRELDVSVDYPVGLTDDPTPAPVRNGEDAQGRTPGGVTSTSCGRRMAWWLSGWAEVKMGSGKSSVTTLPGSPCLGQLTPR